MSKLNNVILGRRIRSIRNELKLDQKRFAEKIDATVSALSNWECGRNKPKEMFLEKIAELGNTTVDILLDREVVDYKQLYESEKQRVDELEREKNEAVLALFNQKDYYGKLVDEEKQRADRLEKRWNELRKFILEEEQFYVDKEMHEYKEAVHEILGKLYELEEDDE